VRGGGMGLTPKQEKNMSKLPEYKTVSVSSLIEVNNATA
jgi:hypothetical protein